MKYLSVFLVALLCITFSCEKDITVLNSQERLQNKLDDFVESKPQLAISAAIIKNGHLYTAVSGQSFDDDSFDEQRLFLAASTTKMFIAALTIKYAEENQISLDNKISDFISLDDRFSEDISIRHLLTHSSGLEDFVTDEYLGAVLSNPSHIFSSDERISFVPETITLPGETFQYSNTNYLLLGLLLETWSERGLHELLRQDIFDPLNLFHTALSPYESINGPIEHLWTDIDEDGIMDNITELGVTTEALLSGAWASGGIVSTPGNMARFLEGLIEEAIINETQLQSMQQFTEIIPGQYAYGMGLQKITIDGEEWIGHDGSLLHYTMAFYHPATDSYMAIMANQEGYDFDNLLLGIADIF
ncbi:MAG: beta-lactamase family protein [Chitinophagales bacterium]|nr:beta-lactamase family protein [Chitinophagales bacterium]